MESRQNGAMLGLPDRFVAVEIETQATPAFDAAQYSFFGDLSAADSGLEGALEDGLEASPDEEGLFSHEDGLGLHGREEEALPGYEVEDLSVAALFRSQLALGPAKTPTKRVDPEYDAGLDALLADPLSVARSQLHDEDYDHRELPSELYPDGLSRSQTAASAQPQSLFTPTQQPSSYNLFDPYPEPQPPSSAPHPAPTASSGNGGPAATIVPSQPQQPQPQDGSSSSAGNTLLQVLKKPSPQPPRAMTLEELERRMLGNMETAAAPAAGGEAAAQQPQPPPGAPPPFGPPPGIPGDVTGPMPPPGGPPLYPQMLPPGPPPLPQHQQMGPHGPLLPPPGGLHGAMMPPPGPGMQPSLYHMHPQMQQPYLGGMYGGHPGAPPPMAGPAGPGGPYGPPPPMGGHPGAYPPPPPHPMFNAGGGVAPPLAHHHIPHHHMQPPHHPGGMMPPGGPMMPPGYGPAGGPMGPRAPMHPGGGPPMGMPGHSPFPHDPSYAMRPGGPNFPGAPGMPPGPPHGGPQRPTAYGPGPSHATPPPPSAPAPPQRPPGIPGPQGPPPPAAQQQPPAHAGAAGAAPRSGAGALGAGGGAAGPLGQRPPQAQGRRGSGTVASDFGLPFGRGAPPPPGPQTAIALAAAAAAAGRAGGALRGPGGRLAGKYMTPENIEYVVRSLLHNVATGVPYVEDYYYQAFVHKHLSAPSRQQMSPGAFPMAALFVPSTLRTPSADQMRVMRLDPSVQVKFVEGVEGLGKIVLSNIRTPKVLMDLSDRGAPSTGAPAKLLTAAGEGEAAKSAASDSDAARSTRPLEQEPLLAARIMIEDCMNLLLDLDDIDRLATHMAGRAQAQQRAAAVAAVLPLPVGPAAAAAAGAGAPALGPYGPESDAPPSPAELLQRRELLLAGINGAFRLPESPQAGAAAAAVSGGDAEMDDGGDAAATTEDRAGSLGDGVLLRILALSKGRNMVARALLATAPPTGFAALLSPVVSTANRASSSAPAGATAATAAQRSQSPQQDTATPAAAAADAASLTQGTATAATDQQLPAQVDASTPSPYVLLWATLRNAWQLFGSSLQQGLDAASERSMLESTGRLAAALRDALLRLPSPRDVVDAAVAFNTGCQQHVESLGPGAAGSVEATLLPLAQTRSVETAAVGAVPAAPAAWLGEALAALVMRAAQLGLLAAAATTGSADSVSAASEGDAGAGSKSEEGSGREQKQRQQQRGAVEAAWSREYGRLHERLSRHLTALGGIHGMAVSSGNTEAMAVVRALCCRQLVNAMLPHASEQQAQQLRDALAAFAA